MQVEGRKCSCFFAAEYYTNSSYSYNTLFTSMAFPTPYCNQFIFSLWFMWLFTFSFPSKLPNWAGEGRGEGNRHKTQISNTVRFGRFWHL